MRAVFSVDLPLDSNNTYLSNEEFRNRIRAYGWEDIKLKDLSDGEREHRYRELAENLWDYMPEISDEEKHHIVFLGVLQDSQTKFVISRLIEGQVTFRLLQPNLARLQTSTAAIISKLLQAPPNENFFQISNQRVYIYERGYAQVLLSGRVIESPLREAIRLDRKNMLLFILPYILLLPILTILTVYTSSTSISVLVGTLERLSTALLTTSIVGAIGFIQTYFQVRTHRLIEWIVAEDIRQ